MEISWIDLEFLFLGMRLKHVREAIKAEIEKMLGKRIGLNSIL